MKQFKTALIYGAMAGVIMTSSWWIFNLSFGDDLSLGQQEFIGYAAMILALSTVFIGVKRYRDQQDAYDFSFRKAFLTGLYIVLVASAIYVIGWMIYYPNFMPDFVEDYTATQIAEYEASGMSAKEIDTRKKEIKDFMEMYKNPFVMVGMTFLEVFPVGLIIAFITALILKRKKSGVGNG